MAGAALLGIGSVAWLAIWADLLPSETPPSDFINLVVGPLGALVLAASASLLLWRAHLKQVAEQREDQKAAAQVLRELLERQININEKNAESMDLLTATVKDALAYVTGTSFGAATTATGRRNRRPGG